MTDNAGMKVTFTPIVHVAAIGVFTVSLQAADGLLIVEKSMTGGTPTINQIQMEANRMRAETTGPGGEKQILIFDGARQVMLMIDDQRKSYTELTKADMEQLGAQMSDAMAQIQKTLAGLPPEKKAEIEAMMKGRMGGAGLALPKTTYKKSGTDTVGKWTCTKYDGYDGPTKTSEVCTVEPKALGLTEADFAVTKQFIEFFKKIIPAIESQTIAIGTVEAQGFSGVPVKRSTTVLGRQVTSEITEVSRKTFTDASYAAPAGYQKRAFAGGRGR